MYILNDYSINNQFDNIEDLLASLLEHTIPLFSIMELYNVNLLKSHEIYDLKIVTGISIFDFLNKRNYPEISKFKSLLHKILYDDPYWEKVDLNHDCLTEAFNKNTGLISFEHEEYLGDSVKYSSENDLHLIPNHYNKRQFINELWKRDSISVDEYLERKYPIIQGFCFLNGINYFETFIKVNDIKQEGINKIIHDIEMFMSLYLEEQDLGRFSKNIEKNLHEFRTTIDGAKEVRIFYCLNRSKITFLNCFIKKQQKTTESEKILGRRLRDDVVNRVK